MPQDSTNDLSAEAAELIARHETLAGRLQSATETLQPVYETAIDNIRSRAGELLGRVALDPNMTELESRLAAERDFIEELRQEGSLTDDQALEHAAVLESQPVFQPLKIFAGLGAIAAATETHVTPAEAPGMPDPVSHEPQEAAQEPATAAELPLPVPDQLPSPEAEEDPVPATEEAGISPEPEPLPVRPRKHPSSGQRAQAGTASPASAETSSKPGEYDLKFTVNDEGLEYIMIGDTNWLVTSVNADVWGRYTEYRKATLLSIIEAGPEGLFKTSLNSILKDKGLIGVSSSYQDSAANADSRRWLTSVEPEPGKPLILFNNKRGRGAAYSLNPYYSITVVTDQQDGPAEQAPIADTNTELEPNDSAEPDEPTEPVEHATVAVEVADAASQPGQYLPRSARRRANRAGNAPHVEAAKETDPIWVRDLKKSAGVSLTLLEVHGLLDKNTDITLAELRTLTSGGIPHLADEEAIARIVKSNLLGRTIDASDPTALTLSIPDVVAMSLSQLSGNFRLLSSGENSGEARRIIEECVQSYFRKRAELQK